MTSIKHGYYFLAAIVLAAFSPLANSAAAVCNQGSHNDYSGEFDGRFYQVVVADGISWDDAEDDAKELDHDGVLGQLATINSFAEDEFVHCLIQAKAPGKESWIGGSQADESVEPDQGWQWLNGELIDPSNDTGLNYTNWQDDEPNNAGTPNERHLAASFRGDFGWNDEGQLGNIGAYVVEFGDALAPIPATDCAFGGLADARSAKAARSSSTRSGNALPKTGWSKCARGRWTIGPGLCAEDLPVGVIPPPVILDLVPGDGPLVIAPYLCSS